MEFLRFYGLLLWEVNLFLILALMDSWDPPTNFIGVARWEYLDSSTWIDAEGHTRDIETSLSFPG